MNKSDSGNERRSSKIHDYVGVSGHNLRIVTYSDHFFISRKYDNAEKRRKIKLKWRFNKKGRIDYLESFLYRSGKQDRFFKVSRYDTSNFNWDNAGAFFTFLPPDTSFINPGFKKLEITKKYQSLVRLGHSIALQLITNIRNDKIKDSVNIESNQKGLTQIIEDKITLDMVRATAAILPSLHILERQGDTGVFKVKYRFNEEYHPQT